jgi:voltage-gated potassium channel
MNDDDKMSAKTLRLKLHEVIFEADTPAGKTFDIILIASIILSVIAIMLDSIKEIRSAFGYELYMVEWIFTILFTLEYLLRLFCIGKPRSYALSFYGVIDLLAVLPTYLSLILTGTQFLLVIRILRVLRVFRILKIVQYMNAAKLLKEALIGSKTKIIVFLYTILTLVVIMGSTMYMIEGEANGFTSIPKSIYWAIVTLTTVGFGDITPQTPLGQFIASIIMIMGYGIIAVPTGIVSAEYAIVRSKYISTQACPECSKEGHDGNAVYCKYCGSKL